MPAAAIAALIPSIIQGITSLSQSSKANRLANEYNQPNMELPQGLLDALDIKKNQALQTGLPRQDLIQEGIDQSIANALGGVKAGATSANQVIGAANSLGGMAAEKNKELGIAGANYAVGAKSELAQALEGLAQYQEKQFMYNQYSPYMDAMNTVRSLRDASTKNLYSGVSNAAGVIANNPDIFSGLGKKNADPLAPVDSGINPKETFDIGTFPTPQLG